MASGVENPAALHMYFSPQKGVSEFTVKHMDQSMTSYSEAVETAANMSLKNLPGARATGGLGFALMAVGAKLMSGARLISEAIQLEQAVQVSDLVLTGEGRSDKQTFYGKAPGHVAKMSKSHEIPCILLSGSIDDSDGQLCSNFSGVFSIVREPLSEDDCIKNADQLLYQQTSNIIHFYKQITESRGL